MLRRVKHKTIDIYARAFGGARFRRLNLFLLELGAAGLGVGAAIPLDKEVDSVRTALAGVSDPVIMDVGANVGDFSELVMAQYSGAQVYAFEPSAATFVKLAERAKSRGFVAIQAAMGAKAGKSVLFDRADASHGQHASLYEKVISELHHQGGDGVRRQEIEVQIVDEFLAARSIPHVHLLKIDAEGAELDILKGAARSIAEGRIGAVHFEFNEMNLVSRSFMHDFLDILPNYDFYRIGRVSLIPILRAEARLFSELFAYQKVLAVRSGPTQKAV